MRLTHTHAKLFLLSGTLCSGAALVIAITLAMPQAAGRVALRAAAAVGGAPISMKEFASLSLLTPEPQADPAPSPDRLIYADLDGKRISVREDGKEIAFFPILSIGRPGTFWETPAGDYAVKTKEFKHLSSIGGTWMPWSMQFYGNFFIHGWPTYQNGEDVPKGYSGGCIRLSTRDAESLYKLVDIGTRVLVRGGTKPPADAANQFYMREAERLPPIYAKSFAVFDEDSGQVLWSRGLDTQVNPGHLVALMTALVSAETIDQYKFVNFERVVAGKLAAVASASDPSAVQVGSLLYPLLFEGNDMAAKGIISFRGANLFTKDMNEKSAAIGMNATNWAAGTADDASLTTARDLETLMRYADNQKSFLMKATLAREHTFVTPAGVDRFSWTNKNAWLDDAQFAGGLSVTEDDHTGNVLAFYDLPVSEFGSRHLGFIVLGSAHPRDDLAALKDYAGSHFFYGSESGMMGTQGAATGTDMSAKADELKLIKSQLVN